ncbi:MAG: hypothetical protein AB1716_03185 [Planctomycetota bacterium]
MVRDVLKTLREPDLVALRCPPDAWPRGLLSETPIPDPWLGLLLKADGRRRIVPSGEDPRPERDDTLLLVRRGETRVELPVCEVPTADGHVVSGTVELVLRCPPRDDDLAALARSLLTGDELRTDGLARAVREAGGRMALQRFIRDHAAEKLVYEDPGPLLADWLRKELQRFFFATGLELERLGRIDLSSESLAHHQALERHTTQRVRALEARDLVERTAMAAARRRLDDLGTVLVKLKEAAAAHGALQWRDLLPTLTPGERGRLLENLWRLTPDRDIAEAIVVVAGHECVWLDPQAPDRVIQRAALSDDFGGLRSVSFDAEGRTLLIGAAHGVWRLGAQDGHVLAQYEAVPAEPPRTGFNAAVITGGRLFATHSQLGAWSWDLDRPAEATPLLRPIAGVPRTIRAVTADEHGRVLLAADHSVHAFSIAGEEKWISSPADGSIHMLRPLDEWLYAATAEGSLLRCTLAIPGDWLVVHRALGPIESLVARRWDDLVELVIPAGRQGVQGIFAEEGMVARLLEAAVAVRRAWACDDALVALCDQRERLLVLNAALPGRAPREVSMARLFGRPVQDVCITTKRAAPAAPAPEQQAEPHA